MKNNVLRILTVVIVGALTVNAQLSRGVVAKVPFHFAAGYKSFPAGEYRVFSGPSPGIMSVQSVDGKRTGFAMSQRAESRKAPTKSSLVFNRYGDRYFLAQIWVAGDTSGAEVRKTPAELEAAKKAEAAKESVIASKGR